jgi:hypothetical protein
MSALSAARPNMAHAFFPERLSNLCQVSVALFEIFVQNVMQFLCWIHCKISSSKKKDKKRHKNKHIHSAA